MNNLDLMLKQMDKIDDILYESNKEFQRLMDETLDVYNEGAISKEIMTSLMSIGRNRIEENQKALNDAQELRKEVMKLKENM